MLRIARTIISTPLEESLRWRRYVIAPLTTRSDPPPRARRRLVDLDVGARRSFGVACARRRSRSRSYGFMHTLQPATYGRVVAGYSGVFVAMALLWGWQVEHVRPDRFDLIGGHHSARCGRDHVLAAWLMSRSAAETDRES